MNIVIPVVIAASIFSVLTSRSLSVSPVNAGETKQVIYIASDLPGAPDDPGPYGGNPHGGNPHGGDPHDENHDPALPSNDEELKRKNPDPRAPIN